MLKQYKATMSLIFVNIIMFIMQMMTYNGALTMGGFYAPYIVASHEYGRFILSGFLHTGIIHLLFNMVSLYMVGTILEPFFKAERLLLMYVLGVIMGNLVTFAFGSWQVVSVGASGAIFGMFVVVALLAKLMPYQTGIRLLSQQFVTVIVINLLFSLAPGINIYGHLGGMLGGAFAFYGLGYYKDNRKNMTVVFLLYAIVGIGLYLFGMNRLV